MSDRETRAGQNEATARQINEQLEDAHGDSPDGGLLPMVCECGNAACEETIGISPDEYQRLRQAPRRFAVLRAHVIADVEEIVDETDRYVVVEKRDEAFRDVSDDKDPR